MPDIAPAYKGYRMYPRGFWGASLGEQIKPSERPTAQLLKTHQYHPDWFKAAANPKEVNINIERMWRHLNDEHDALFKFEFREKVLRIAKTAFGTEDFVEWLDVQRSGPSTGDLHMEFILDTMQYIMTGKRRLNLHAWTAMLSNMEISHNETSSYEPFEWFFVADDKRARNVRLIDVIQRWVNHPDGFSDLAHTLHVLFGEIQS